MSLGRIKDIGAVALSAGLAQVAATTLLGAGLAMLLGLSRSDALVLGLALAFSSTVVVVKRSLSAGYAGIRNELFQLDNSLMLLDFGRLFRECLVQAAPELRIITK